MAAESQSRAIWQRNIARRDRVILDVTRLYEELSGNVHSSVVSN